jgi:hypothetical protein
MVDDVWEEYLPGCVSVDVLEWSVECAMSLSMWCGRVGLLCAASCVDTP